MSRLLFSSQAFSLYILYVFLIPSLSADTFIMKDGSKLKGEILSQTFDQYTLKVEIAENILQEKKILVADVVEIIREDKSALEFKKISSLFPLKDLLEVEDYEKIHKKYFLSFYEDYSTSKYLDKVTALETLLKEELEIVAAGGLKIGGRLLNTTQIDSNKYEIMAIVELENIRKYAKSRRYLSALRNFEEMKLHYQHTRPYREAAKEAQSILPKLKSIAKKLEAGVDAKLEKKEKFLKSLSISEATRIKSLLELKQAKYKRVLATAKELKTKWLPLNEFEKDPINKVLSNIEQESKALAKLEESELKDAGKTYREILDSIFNGDYKLAKEQLRGFISAKPPQSYISDLEIQILEIEEEAVARMKQDQAKAAAEAKELARMRAEERRRKLEEEELKKKGQKKKKRGLLEQLENGLNTQKKYKELEDASQ